MSTTQLVNNITVYILNPVIALMFAAGLLVFVWGLVEFLIGLNVGDGDHTKQEDGKRHMLWGLVGMFIMFAASTILVFIANNVCGGLATCATPTL